MFDEILIIVLSFLDQKELKCAEQVCHQWYHCCRRTNWHVACLNILAQLRLDKTIRKNRLSYLRRVQNTLAAFVRHPSDLFETERSTTGFLLVHNLSSGGSSSKPKRRRKQKRKTHVLLNSKTSQVAKQLFVPSDPKMVMIALDQANKKWNFLSKGTPVAEMLWEQVKQQTTTVKNIMKQILKHRMVSLKDIQLRESQKKYENVLVNKLCAFGNVVAFSFSQCGAVGLVDIYTTKFVLPDAVFYPHWKAMKNLKKGARCQVEITHMVLAKPERAHISVKYQCETSGEIITILYNVHKLVVAGKYSSNRKPNVPFLQEWNIYQCANDQYAHIHLLEIPRARFEFVHDYLAGITLNDTTIVERFAFDNEYKALACYLSFPSTVLLYLDKRLTAVYRRSGTSDLDFEEMLGHRVVTVTLFSDRQMSIESPHSILEIHVDKLCGFVSDAYEIKLIQNTALQNNATILVNRYCYTPEYGSFESVGQHATADSLSYHSRFPSSSPTTLNRFAISKTGKNIAMCWIRGDYSSITAIDYEQIEHNRLHTSISIEDASAFYGADFFSFDQWEKVLSVAIEENTLFINTDLHCYYGCFIENNSFPTLTLVPHVLPSSKLYLQDNIPSIIHNGICVNAYAEVDDDFRSSVLCFTY